jgi:hypothetical protein
MFFTKGGVNKYDLWPPTVGNSWRTADDIQDNWTAMIANIDQVRLYCTFYMNNLSSNLE